MLIAHASDKLIFFFFFLIAKVINLFCCANWRI